jgi:hypothetical protein
VPYFNHSSWLSWDFIAVSFQNHAKPFFVRLSGSAARTCGHVAPVAVRRSNSRAARGFATFTMAW